MRDALRWGLLLVLALIAALCVWYFLPPAIALVFNGFALPVPLVWLLAAAAFLIVMTWYWWSPRIPIATRRA